jgi:hypothetical protein
VLDGGRHATFSGRWLSGSYSFLIMPTACNFSWLEIVSP